ncbi:MAG: AAA family ATPase [Flavobacteriales bacterium]|nr:AAA family ATPase [Flavobacteriales bacterium]
MAALAARFVNSTDRHIFLTGKAGTGKTTFLRQLAHRTHKRYVILAPTGIAALNAGGVTIHSQFLLPFGSFIPERQLPSDVGEYGQFHDRDTLNRRHPLNALRRNVLRGVDLLIIDEVSMLRADLLDAIDHRMRHVRQRYDRSFGGAQVLFIGDLYQLPPVVKDDEWRVLKRWYESPHFFEARVVKEAGYAHIELDRIFRQQDPHFIRILNHLREDAITAEDIATLNRHHRPEQDGKEKEGVITLTTHNRTADAINQRALDALPGSRRKYEAEIGADFPESMFPVLRDLELKVGAQVMFTRNDAEKAYFNGKLARVTAADAKGVTVEMLDDGTHYKLKREVWENRRYVVDPATKVQNEEVLGTFEQYPVRLAWAITVHKSQGLTFDRAIIDVGKAFAPGQVYVALSRLRSLDGLILRTPIDPHVVSTDRDVVAFSERRHAQPPLPEQLLEHQRLYLEDLLRSAFDLEELLRRAEYIGRDHADVATFEDESMRTALERLRDKLRAEATNTRTFQAQLVRLLQEDDREALLDRLGKGASYYDGLLNDAMQDLLQHIAQVEQLSRTKQYANALRELDGMLVKKIAMIAKTGPLCRAILEGRAIEPMPELERELTGRRTRLVERTREWVKEHMPETSRRSGRRRVRKGEETFAVEKPKPLKGETYLRTYAAIKEGKGLDEIARERGLSPATIEGHAARGIGEGILEIDAFMTNEVRDTIADRMREHPDQGLNGARAHFGDRFSYGQLRMVQAWMKQGMDG